MAAIASAMPVRMAVAPKARATNAARALKATTVTGKALRFAPLRCGDCPRTGPEITSHQEAHFARVGPLARVRLTAG